MSQIELKRDTLYEEVWTTPVSRLASQYDLSDVGLRKVCRKLNIPMPYRGYWAKLRHGKKPARTPLPELGEGKPDVHIVHTISEKQPPTLKEVLPETLLSTTFNIRKEITVPQQLRAPHPLVQKTHEALKEAHPDRYQRISPRGGAGLDVNVCRPSVNRALRILNTIVKEAERIGVKVMEGDNQGGSYLLIENERVRFGIEEKVRREDHIPKPGESKWVADRWDYFPTGQLVLKLKHSESMPRKKWSDTKNKQLEDMINSFLSSAIAASAYLKKDRQEREEWQRRWEEEQRVKREQKRLRVEEERRRKELEDQAARWTKSQHLLAYIEEVERLASEQEMTAESVDQLERWLTWAREHADRLNPLSYNLLFHEDTSSSTSETYRTLKSKKRIL